MTLFVDIEKRSFYFIDSFGTTTLALESAFNNWLKFVQTRADLLALHNDQPFTAVLVAHPLQKDSYNCGVFVCKFVSMLLQEESITQNSFHPTTSIAEYRSTIMA